jgi:hypothetical protein
MLMMTHECFAAPMPRYQWCTRYRSERHDFLVQQFYVLLDVRLKGSSVRLSWRETVRAIILACGTELKIVSHSNGGSFEKGFASTFRRHSPVRPR